MRSSEPLFRVPPFPAFPSINRYVALGSIHDAMTRVGRSIEAREGISLVIGPPGTGKSLLANLLQESYRESREVVLLGEAPIGDPSTFGHHLLHHLGVDRKQLAESDLHLALGDYLAAPEASEGGLLILVDEAQSLSPEVLETIRMTTNIMRRGEPRVSAVLCGGPKLDETLADPALEPLTQRVATRCYLHPLNLQESRQYITDSIRACGADPRETIREEAIAAVHHACSGVPRLINQLMTQAIDCAEASGQSVISEEVIDRAWAQLQQLPGPMLEEPEWADRGEAIEFGELEEPVAPPAAAEPQLALRPEPESFGGGSPAASGAFPERQDAFPEQGSGHAPTFPAEHLAEPASEPEQPHQPPESVAQLACPESLPSALFGEALFGEFDDEEEVFVGVGTPPQSAATEPVDAADPLEAVLHQEIVGIASQAAEAAGDPPAQAADDSGEFQPRFDAASCHQASGKGSPDATGERSAPVSEAAAEASCETTAENDEPSQQSEPQRGEAPAAPAQPVIWLTETEDGDLIRDDRDLLVVEDEVDVERGPAVAATTDEDEETTVTVDFQAMLERMRNGS